MGTLQKSKPSGVKMNMPEVKRVRAMGMFELKVKGWTHEEIAAEYRCSTDTVARLLDWAAREGQILKHEEAILDRLMPKAIAVYEKALDNNDVFVAKDLMATLSRLSERIDKRQEHVEELSLAAYLKTRRRTENPDRGVGVAVQQQAGVHGPVQPLEVIEAEFRAGDDDGTGEDEAGASRLEPLRPDGSGLGEVPRDAEEVPAGTGEDAGAGGVPEESVGAGGADGSAGIAGDDPEAVPAAAAS